ncbi:MAG TPA: GSCFA domain-containing protein [Aquaticitalea sp.]|nr:GSCFA domain-containing protein [Aquaticitalea sp.]
MKLQTQIPLEKQSDNLLDYSSNVLLLGSCFVENIGDKMAYFKFKNLSNPFGILFHPKAIETLMTNAIKQKQYSEAEVFFHNEQWHSYDAHSNLSDAFKEKIIQTLNHQLSATAKQLISATHIIITLGTAWTYIHSKTNSTVANCHKVPQKEFEKKLLSVEDIVNSLKMTVEQIHQINPKASIIFTVSPVRHIKDGFVENTLSKSHLIASIHQLLSEHVHLTCSYFPSYEIMIDELRDYRFYDGDMLHPNQTAIEYIWRKFQSVWISDEALKTMEEVDSVQKGLKHKPFNAGSKAHQKFLHQLELKKEKLQREFPHIKF